MTDLQVRENHSIAQVCERIESVRGEIVRLIESGNAPSTAAAAAGIPRRTWAYWRKQGEDGIEPYRAMLDDVERALATFEALLVDKLANPPKGPDGRADNAEVRATTFLLERTRRERFGNRLEVRASVEQSMNDLLDEIEANMSPAAFQELCRAMAIIEQAHEGE